MIEKAVCRPAHGLVVSHFQTGTTQFEFESESIKAQQKHIDNDQNHQIKKYTIKTKDWCTIPISM